MAREDSGSISSHFDGLLEEFGLYSRRFHYGDVLDLYNGGSGIPYTAAAPAAADNALAFCNF